MNRRRFNYDVVKFIQLIEKKPCIWDKSHKHRKNRIKKQLAWQKIYSTLDSSYDTSDEKKQKEIAEVINIKWTHIRDAFLKSLKVIPGQEGTKKKYIYFDQLLFLFKNEDLIMPEPSNDDAASKATDEECAEAISSSSSKAEQRTIAAGSKCEGQRKTEREAPRVPQDADEDDAFFKSIKPAVVRMDEDEKYDFRMGVMRVIQQIKRRKQLSSQSLSSIDLIRHSGPSQRLIKQYAHGGPLDEENPHSASAEQYNYMIMPVSSYRRTSQTDEMKSEMCEDSDMSET